MSVKVTFQLELSQAELRDLLDNRMGNKIKNNKESIPASMPGVEQARPKENHQAARKIRNIAAPRSESEKKYEKKLPMMEGPKAAPAAYVANIGDLTDFLRSQPELSGLQMLDLDNATSWLH